jgi:hypothetical protein
MFFMYFAGITYCTAEEIRACSLAGDGVFSEYMADTGDYVTVFRSAENNAREEAEAVRDRLVRAGFQPLLVDDDVPGVVEGTCEVRVPAEKAPEAESILATEIGRTGTLVEGDDSHDMDLVPIFESQAANAEVEALGIRAILDASDIPAVVMDAAVLPNLPHTVKVPREFVDQAMQAIAEARAAGPAAAEEAVGGPIEPR